MIIIFVLFVKISNFFIRNVKYNYLFLRKIIYNMAVYKKFLIQQQTYNGSTYENVGSVVDTQTSYRIVCQECPFKILPETKELPKRNWHDENGEDVYIPTDGLKFKPYDIEIKFLYVGKDQTMFTDINGFIEFLYGRNTNGSPLLAIYDEYTKTGRRGVYVTEVSNEFLTNDDSNPEVVGSFKVKFRVTDPVTAITLSVNG